MPLNYFKSHAIDVGLFLGQPTLAAICLFIIARQPGPFPIYFYFGWVLALIGVSLPLFVKVRNIWLPICNYILIFGVLAGRQLDIPANVCLLLYPLIEGIIFRGRIQNIYILMPMALSVSIGLMAFDRFQGFILLFEVLLGLANIYRQEEDKMLLSENKVYDSFDNLLRKRNITHHTHELTRMFIMEWNKIYPDIPMADIETYRNANGNFYLINSAHFTWNRRLHLSESDVERLSSGRVIVAEDRYRDIWMTQYLVPVSVDEEMYIVKYSVFHRKGFSWFEGKGIQRALNGISGKLVNILVMVHRLKKHEAAYLEENKKKKKYIDSAIGTMHFIRNRLTSIANLVEFLRLPEEERVTVPKSIVDKLYESASHDYANIKKYADDLLNKEKDPFGDRGQDEIPVQSLYVYLAESVEHHLGVYVDTQESNDDNNPDIQVNYFDLKTILTDWISNMEKYGEDNRVEWVLDNQRLSVIFRNRASTSDCEKVVEALTNDNVEIRHTRKQTFGINNIRENALKNNIIINADVENIDTADEAVLVVSFIILVENEE